MLCCWKGGLLTNDFGDTWRRQRRISLAAAVEEGREGGGKDPGSLSLRGGSGGGLRVPLQRRVRGGGHKEREREREFQMAAGGKSLQKDEEEERRTLGLLPPPSLIKLNDDDDDLSLSTRY